MSLRAPILGLAFAISLSGLAAAQTPTPAPAQTRAPNPASAACKADVKLLCGDVQRGGGRVGQCMKANADKLSPGCKDAMAKNRAARKAAQGK